MLVVGLTAIFIAIVLLLVFLVEVALYFVPARTEAELFADWLPEDLVTISPSDDRLYETQMLLNRLSAHWADAPYTFRVEVDDSDTANAMALPGGLIVVTRGLLDEVESENELAFVLGHELGHFRNRDHLRALGRGALVSLFFVVVTGNDVAGIGINVADVTLRGFGRDQESDADEFGLAVVYAEYGHVNEAWRLFERWDEQRGSVPAIVNYLATHPDAGDRVERLEQIARDQQWPVDGAVRALKW